MDETTEENYSSSLAGCGHKRPRLSSSSSPGQFMARNETTSDVPTLPPPLPSQQPTGATTSAATAAASAATVSSSSSSSSPMISHLATVNSHQTKDLMGRLQAFLPQLKAANEQLQSSEIVCGSPEDGGVDKFDPNTVGFSESIHQQKHHRVDLNLQPVNDDDDDDDDDDDEWEEEAAAKNGLIQEVVSTDQDEVDNKNALEATRKVFGSTAVAATASSTSQSVVAATTPTIQIQFMIGERHDDDDDDDYHHQDQKNIMKLLSRNDDDNHNDDHKVDYDKDDEDEEEDVGVMKSILLSASNLAGIRGNKAAPVNEMPLPSVVGAAISTANSASKKSKSLITELN